MTVSTPVVMCADCCGDPGSSPTLFKYDYCHSGIAGPCCAPARGFELNMTWPQWKYVRDHTSLPWQEWLSRIST